MSNYKTVFFTLGILQIILGISMVIPILTQFIYSEMDSSFIGASIISIIFGVLFFLTNLNHDKKLNLQQAFLLTALSWLSIAIFGSLPFIFSSLELSITDAFFESMSGITTTGSTVIVGLDTSSPGLLLWRSLLQWLGGIGIIVMALAVMPLLRVGGMQLFRMESSDLSEKALPRAAQVAAVISIIYVFLTMIWAGLLWFAGMSGFDAVAHAMTTIATGGFSTHDASIGHFDSLLIDAIITAGMIVGSLPFLLYLMVLQGKPSNLFNDSQVQWFLMILAIVIIFLAGWLWLENGNDPIQALRFAAFNVASIMTGTGYVTAGYDKWGSFAVPIFFFVFFATYLLLAVALGFLGLDFITSISAAASAISNVGPGLGPVVGPEGNYASLPTAAKWILSIGMLLGRLELFTVMVLFTRSFWRA